MKLTKRQFEAFNLLKSHKDNFIFYRITTSSTDRPFMCYLFYDDYGDKRIQIIDYRTADSLANKKLIKKQKLENHIEVFADRFDFGSIYLKTIWIIRNKNKSINN